jgi:phosphoenolpyruvate---glycerone phosphotransferase subunit DhaL
MLAGVALGIQREEAQLNALDAALGDGDHGISMRVGFQAIATKLEQLDQHARIDQLLRESGMAFMGATGGAIGIVFGRMLVEAGNALKGVQQFGAFELRTLLSAMANSAAGGKVGVGDKTILDAADAARRSVECERAEASLAETLRVAANAADVAAQGTAQMVCRVGRASRLGERTLGHPDPGAVSFSIILRLMSAWVESQGAVRVSSAVEIARCS